MSVPYKELFIQLSNNNISYLVVGGFAVNFHQVQRSTVDLDLVVHLESKNIIKFVNLVERLGYRPRVPVKASDFSIPEIRSQWINEKGLMVFSFVHEKNLFENIDVFVKEPKPFDELYSRKLVVKMFGVNVDVIGIDDLIDLKKAAGRDKDLFDISQLEKKKI